MVGFPKSVADQARQFGLQSKWPRPRVALGVSRQGVNITKVLLHAISSHDFCFEALLVFRRYADAITTEAKLKRAKSLVTIFRISINHNTRVETIMMRLKA